MFSRIAALPLLFLCAFPAPQRIAAQKHAFGDRSLAASLLNAAIPLPTSTLRQGNYGDEPATRFRFELQYSRSAATAASPLLIVGMRSDHPSSDTNVRGLGVVGVRLGFAPEQQRQGGRLPAAVELQVGTRIPRLALDSRTPDVGIDLVAGWSGLDDHVRGTLGVRIPVEYGWDLGSNRVLLSGTPTVAWGHVRFRECENLGYGDNCGDLGVQLEFGRTRFLLAGGATLDLAAAGLSLSLGTQHLLAVGHTPRFALALAWAP
jgi:hypothetical protein